MQVAQIYQLMNTVTKEVIGDQAVIQEDLSNVVDIGKAVFDATSVDSYVKSLVNHIGKVIFVNRAYRGGAPSVLMDGWEFGSVLEKIHAVMPDATENESWQLTDRQSYDQDVFYKPTVVAKFYNEKVTFQIPLSFTEMQVKQSFSSAEQLNGFISMLYNEVEKALTVKIDSLIMRTINTAIGETIADDYTPATTGTYLTTDITGHTGVKAVNLLYEYNQQFSQNLTVAKALTDPDFIRFAVLKMGLYKDRLSKISELFNVGGLPRFTPEDTLHTIMLSEFEKAASVYLYSDTYHDALVRLPNTEVVTFWQGSGTDYAFANTSKIDIKTPNDNYVTVSGVLGVMFDRDALGVCNLDRRVTTHYNARAEFYTNWYKFDSSYFLDLNENIVVFLIA